MGLLSLNELQSVSDVEVALRRHDDDASVDLQVPVKPKNDRIGGEAALVQLIITWARRSKKARLIYRVQELENADGQLEKIVETAFGFVAALMAKKVLSLDPITNISSSIYALASDRIDKMSHVPEPVRDMEKVPSQ